MKIDLIKTIYAGPYFTVEFNGFSDDYKRIFLDNSDGTVERISVDIDEEDFDLITDTYRTDYWAKELWEYKKRKEEKQRALELIKAVKESSHA